MCYIITKKFNDINMISQLKKNLDSLQMTKLYTYFHVCTNLVEFNYISQVQMMIT